MISIKVTARVTGAGSARTIQQLAKQFSQLGRAISTNSEQSFGRMGKAIMERMGKSFAAQGAQPSGPEWPALRPKTIKMRIRAIDWWAGFSKWKPRRPHWYWTYRGPRRGLDTIGIWSEQLRPALETGRGRFALKTVAPMLFRLVISAEHWGAHAFHYGWTRGWPQAPRPVLSVAGDMETITDGETIAHLWMQDIERRSVLARTQLRGRWW